MIEARPLGASSLQALDELASPTATGTLLEVPVGELHFDPEQPRTDFAGESIDPEDQNALQGLAENLAAVGFAQPLRVRPRPDDGGYTVVTGERRLRAARLADLGTVPCLVEGKQEQEDARLLLQISENLQRQDLKLLDLARALDRLAAASDLSDTELAARLGRSKAWFSQHRRILRAKGVAREALEEDLIRSAETLRLFEKAPEAAQKRLLRKARDQVQPIPRGAAQKSAQRQRPKTGPSFQTAPARTQRADSYSLRLSEEDVHRLYALLRLPPPPASTEWTTDLEVRIAALPLPD